MFRCPSCRASRFVRYDVVEITDPATFRPVDARLECVGCGHVYAGVSDLVFMAEPVFDVPAPETETPLVEAAGSRRR